jgi:hypothetical protein
MAIKIIPDPIGHLGGGRGLSVMGGGGVLTYDQRVLALGPIAYWPFSEVAGTTGAASVLDISGNNHHATPANVTFGAAGIGDGETSATFNGSNSAINAFSAGLAGAFDGAEGSLLMWLRFAAWGPLVYGLFLSDFTLQVLSAGTDLYLFIKTGGVEKTHVIGGMSTTEFFSIAMTWSESNDRKNSYLSGAVVAPELTGLGVWSTPLTQFTIGASDNTGAGALNGGIAKVALFDKELSAAQVAAIATP